MEYRKKKRKFTLNEVRADKKDPKINEAVWNEKKRRWVHPFTQTGYIQPFVRSYFADMKTENCNSKEFRSATKFVSRCLEKFEKGEFNIERNDSKNKFRLIGAGPPKRAIEVRIALFDYFIDVRSTLKGRFPKFMSIVKAKEIYNTYCGLKEKAGEKAEELKFTDKWVDGWCKEMEYR